MTEEEFQVELMDALSDPYWLADDAAISDYRIDDDDDEQDEKIKSVRTFDEVGVMMYNKGLVVTCSDGSRFQVTIVKQL